MKQYRNVVFKFENLLKLFCRNFLSFLVIFFSDFVFKNGSLRFCRQKRASPAAEDLENLKKKLFQMEVKLTSMSEEHKQE